MNPYQNYFPTGYQNPYQQQYQQYQPQNYQQNTLQGQTMTLPTIHAEIIQVNDENEASGFNVAAGASQMMIDKTDSAIYVKTAYANGQYQLDVYEKRKSVPVSNVPNLENYVTWDMLEKRLSEFVTSPNSVKSKKREEVTNNE